MIRPAVLVAMLAVATSSPRRVEPPIAAIRVNQAGVEADGVKVAVIATAVTTAQPWTLYDSAGRTVATGTTTPFGADAASGEHLQHLDFSRVTTPGEGYRLRAGTARSHPFAIRPRPYAGLATAAMAFFYQQRSGVPILAAYVEHPDLARAAGQPHERVMCFAGEDERGVRWPGCDYQLDTTGGWYDAGDHGKYVVNGGIAAWTLLDLHERLAAWNNADAFADGRLALPEDHNGRDDLLDEARVEIAFLLSMQIPAGRRLSIATTSGTGTNAPASRFVTIDAGGLAHTKVADERWTALPMAPAHDPMRRFLYPPSTAATLNLAAVAAQAARIWRLNDPVFAARARRAADRAWAAALRQPDLFASSDFAGSGGYGDRELDDERFWAAAELLATTGDARFAAIVRTSPLLVRPDQALNWGRTEQAGLATLATSTAMVPADIRRTARATIVQLADTFMAERVTSGYRLPFASPDYGWGSNSVLLNRALLLGIAWQVTRRLAYRAAAADVIDYLLGRNPLDRSFITGFGVRTVHQPHHRFWANAADRRFPEPPSGVLVGGPNSTAMNDKVAETLKGRCTGQTCWVDDWRAFTMNEVAINWNAPLAWVAAFLDATRSTGRRLAAAPGSETARRSQP